MEPDTDPDPEAKEPQPEALEPVAPQHVDEPLIPWWMFVVALVAPLISGAWHGATTDAEVGHAILSGLIWPGLPLYFGLIAIFWAAWKIELE